MPLRCGWGWGSKQPAGAAPATFWLNCGLSSHALHQAHHPAAAHPAPGTPPPHHQNTMPACFNATAAASAAAAAAAAGEATFGVWGIFDGHGGRSVATYASNNLLKKVMDRVNGPGQGQDIGLQVAGCALL
jgi:hypothetical protein